MNIKKLLQFSKTLVGIPYTTWTGNELSSDEFFYTNKIPSLEELKENGICCTGLLNILRQYYGSHIPDSNQKYRGGITFWYNYFYQKNVLLPFNYNENYPLGTLFLRKYRNKKDQGHVSILYKKHKNLLYSQIIHAYAQGDLNITILGYSHFCNTKNKTGYYEYAILPDKWLLI